MSIAGGKERSARNAVPTLGYVNAVNGNSRELPRSPSLTTSSMLPTATTYFARFSLNFDAFSSILSITMYMFIKRSFLCTTAA